MADVHFTVGGMDCGACERNIEFALAAVEGVVRAKAEHPNRSVAVTFDPLVTSEAKIRSVIEDIGYRVSLS